MDHPSGNLAARHQVPPSAADSSKKSKEKVPMFHVVHVKTTILGSQTATAEPWKRLITLLQTQHKVAPTDKTCPELNNLINHEESPSAPRSNASAKERAEDWEEDPGVHKSYGIPNVPSVVSSAGWQTRTRRPMNLKHTPNFTNTKQLTASPQNGTSRPSRQSHLLNCPFRDIF